ncbi:MAG TPA: hypothetical protein VF918_21485 [Anaerolineales bacterium]
MKQSHTLLLIFCCLILVLSNAAKARAWRGIVPLHSTRTDVRRLLGKPIVGGDGAIDLYELKEGHLNIRYARRPCEQGLPADWGNWNVPPNTVVNISISLHEELPVKELKIRNLSRYKWYTDNSGATYYHDKRRGIEYQVQDEMVTAITYGPAARDFRLLCRKNLPLIRY